MSEKPAENARPLMTLEALRSVPLFASLDDEDAAGLRSLLELEVRPAGSVLFRKGEDGDAMYLIEGGRVRIHIRDRDGEEVTLAELAGGDFFGEMAILDGKPRSASATVTEDARLAVLSREHFHDYVRRNPDLALEMLERHHGAPAPHGRDAAPARHAQPQRGRGGAPDLRRPYGRRRLGVRR
jgi:signal-transduction protein with cAMP-binding, CBS, and nucleotidyltransferase domain